MRVTPSNSPLGPARKALRARLRAARRNLAAPFRARAARLLAHHVDREFHLRPGLRLAVYASLPEELDTGPLIALARRRGCRIFLPRINRRTMHLRFVESHVGSRAVRNHLGIAEPHGTARLSARWLDLVLTPLVGFDQRGVRLGMGGGFYDRTFAFRNIHRSWRRPRLIGVAYALQQLPVIESAAHDVRLDAVVTEEGVMRCRTG
jgi:5-formyltetrahydrofolate cyclo-ligase